MASVMMTVAGLNVHYEIVNPTAKQTIVCLHGFTGSTETWRAVYEHVPKHIRVVAIDLIGHGKTDSPKNTMHYTMDFQIDILEQLFNMRQLEHFTLIGYSMGGRTALAYAMKYPARVEKLILESASPGLKTEKERRERRDKDHALAARILRDGVEAFVDFWQDIPLFDSQKRLSEQAQFAVRNERLAQTKVGLANSLKGMGTGEQPSYWEQLQTFSKPVVLLTGELDTKFYYKAQEMQELFQNCSHHVINDCGHAIHVENPEVFVTIIMKEI